MRGSLFVPIYYQIERIINLQNKTSQIRKVSFLCQKCLLQHAMAWQWCKKIALLRKLIVSPNLFTYRRNIMGRPFNFWSKGGPEECFANWLFILICCYPSFFFLNRTIDIFAFLHFVLKNIHFHSDLCTIIYCQF